MININSVRRHNEPYDLAAVLPNLLPQAIEWAEFRSAEILSKGKPLTAAGIRIARSVGVLDPKRIRVELVRKGDPPALPGRQPEFDNSGNPIVTPKREPRSSTLRRNYETSRQFKSQPVGV